MTRDYIERQETALYVAGTRVPLDVIVHQYKNGAPVESIRHSFPTLTLEQIHGALAFYLANQAEVDAAMEETEVDWERFRATNPAPADIKRKLEKARQHLGDGR